MSEAAGFVLQGLKFASLLWSWSGAGKAVASLGKQRLEMFQCQRRDDGM